jgi:peptidyl-tRNA hydrolase
LRLTAARPCCRRSAAPPTLTLAFVLTFTLALTLTLNWQSWVGGGEAIIVLGVDSAEQMKSLLSEAAQKGLCTHCVADAGRTEVAPGTETVGCIGPAPVQSIDLVTGHLGLL